MASRAFRLTRSLHRYCSVLGPAGKLSAPAAVGRSVFVPLIRVVGGGAENPVFVKSVNDLVGNEFGRRFYSSYDNANQVFRLCYFVLILPSFDALFVSREHC